MTLSPPAPPVRAAGSRVTGATYEADITDAINFLANVPLFQAYQSGAQALATSTVTAIALDTATIDTYAGHSNSVNNSRYTPTAAGWYLFLGTVSFASSSTGGRDVEFHKNGSSLNLAQGSGMASSGGINTTISAFTVVQMNGAGDYVEMYGYQTSGGSLNTVGTATGFTAFFIHEF